MSTEQMMIGVADYGHTPRPAPGYRDPAKARAARRRTKHERWAEEMRADGWGIATPEEMRDEA